MPRMEVRCPMPRMEVQGDPLRPPTLCPHPRRPRARTRVVKVPVRPSVHARLSARAPSRTNSVKVPALRIAGMPVTQRVRRLRVRVEDAPVGSAIHR
jgi:hypothetical protein